MQEGPLTGPEDSAKGHGRVEAALQAAVHGEDGTRSQMLPLIVFVNDDITKSLR